MLLRRRRLHRQQETAELNVTAFMNLMVVLVPFLLITAVFSRMAVVELTLPLANDEPPEQPEERINIQIMLFSDRIEVADDNGLIERIEHLASPELGPNFSELNRVMRQLKGRLPERRDVTLLMVPETDYQQIVGAMDAIREAVVARKGQPVRAELFPEIAVGDLDINNEDAASATQLEITTPSIRPSSQPSTEAATP